MESHQKHARTLQVKTSALCLSESKNLREGTRLRHRRRTLDKEVISSPLILAYLPDLSIYICVGIICVCYMVDNSVYYLHITNLNPKRKD